MKKETGKEWLHGRRKRIAVVVVLAAAGAIAWLILSLFSGAKEVGFEQVPEDELPEAITSDIIPEYKTLERALACCIDDDIYVIVTRGEKPTSGFKVAVDHMALEEQDGKSTLIVYAGFKDPDGRKGAQNRKQDVSEEDDQDLRGMQAMFHHHRFCRSGCIFRRQAVTLSRRGRESPGDSGV